MLTSDRPTSNTMLTLGLGYLIKYVAYYFLFGMVLLTCAILIAAYVNIFGPKMPFLEYFSFLLPKDQRSSGSWNERDLMRLYNFLTTIFFLLSMIVKLIILLAKKSLRPNYDNERVVENAATNNTYSQIMGRFFINGLIITSINLISLFVFPFNSLSEGSNPMVVYIIFGVFYLFAMIANVAYVLLDTLSNRILAKATTLIFSRF